MMMSQMFDNPKSLAIAAGVLLIMGIVPGMPHFAFLSFGVITAAAAYYIYRKRKRA